jgi:hypothetical protein
VELKDRSIYQLPNGRELIALVTKGEKVVFYNLSAADAGAFKLDAGGRLVFEGRATAWDTSDLIDTGRVASSDVLATLVEAKQTEDVQL